MKKSSRSGILILTLTAILVISTGCGLIGGPAEEPEDPGVETPGDDTAQPGDNGVDTAEPGEEPAAPSGEVTPGTILVDESMTLNAFNTEPVDFGFQGETGLVFRVDAQLTAGVLDYNLEIVDSSQQVMAQVEARTGNSDISIKEFNLPFDGKYFARVQPVSGGGSLRVVLTVMDAPSGGGAISDVGGELATNFYDSGVFHTYRFNLNQGDTYTIGAYAEARGMPDTYVRVFRPDGVLAAEMDDIQAPNDLNAVMAGFVPEMSGEYIAIVSPIEFSRGDYVFSLAEGDALMPVVGDPDMAIDTEYRAKFVEDSPLELTFDATIGQTISIEAYDLETDVLVDIYLYSPYGQIIAFASLDGTSTGTEQIISEIQLPYDGRYLLELIPTGTGEASFRILSLDPEALTGGGLFSDETVSTRSGAFNAANAFHVYQFKADAGDLITLRLESSVSRGTLDIGFALIDPDGLQVTYIDDVMGREDTDPALVDFQITTSGTYTVIVYALTDGTGTYDISFSKR